MKKTKLIVEYEYEFDLIGIISSIKFYKLAWAINNKLGIRLVKEEDHLIEQKNNKKITFGYYLYQLENSNFQLYKNRSTSNEREFLIPEMNHLDYIVKIESMSQSFAKEEVLKELREIKYIEYIATIDVQSLKSKDNFLN